MTYISALPEPPSRADDTTTFSAKADALLGALPSFVTQANTLSDEVDAMRDDTEAKRAATESLRDQTNTIKGDTQTIKNDCEVIKTACETARDTTNTYRGQAETAKVQAQTAAAAAASGAGLPSLVGNAGKQLVVASGEGGVQWTDSMRRLLIFSSEAAALYPVSSGDVLGTIATGLTATGPVIVATGSMFVRLSSATSCQTSPDGIVWTNRTTGSSGLTPGVASSSDGKVVAVYSNTIIRVSTDHGVTWSAGGATPGSIRSQASIAHANSVFLAPAASGTNCYRSANTGTTWATVTLPVADASLVSNGSIFVLGVASNTYHTSTDGTNWTSRTKPVTNPAVCNAGVFIAGGHYSLNGIDWALIPGGLTGLVSIVNGIPVSPGVPGVIETVHNGTRFARGFCGTEAMVGVARKGNTLVYIGTTTSTCAIDTAASYAHFKG